MRTGGILGMRHCKAFGRDSHRYMTVPRAEGGSRSTMFRLPNKKLEGQLEKSIRALGALGVWECNSWEFLYHHKSQGGDQKSGVQPLEPETHAQLVVRPNQAGGHYYTFPLLGNHVLMVHKPWPASAVIERS